VDPSVRLEYARGLLAKRQWQQAAAAFDRYVAAVPDDWEAQFARGTAHANARDGEQADLLALRAYNEALALVPRDENRNWISRFYSYRGAMLKRLGRFDEARNDLSLALAHATSEHDRLDAHYNLAGVHAMSGETQDTIEALEHLVGTHFIVGVREHEGDYFSSLIHDRRFRRLVD
jgi:Flp pilus assembly protein TadD